MENIYVKIEQYQEVLAQIKVLRNKVMTAKETLDHITQLKSEEDAEIESWKHGTEDVLAKIDAIDMALSK